MAAKKIIDTSVEPKGQWPVGDMCSCQKCKKTMNAVKNFFTYKDGSKHKLCKQCLTMHIDNTDPKTFLWILEDFDYPYIPSEWNNILEKAYAKEGAAINGMSVLGKYFSKMRIKQFSQYCWADSQRLQEEEEKKLAAAGMTAIGTEEDRKFYEEQVNVLKEQLESGQIDRAQYETLLPAEVLTKEMVEERNASQKILSAQELAATTPALEKNIYNQNVNFFEEQTYFREDELPDPAADLTEEDKIYLAMKWGRLYKPGEWVELERSYTEMMNSFDVQDADTINTIILICKTNLKLNQAIDMGDLDGYQKLARVSDTLRKSAKLTAAQNKGESSDYVDSIGELVAMCEREEGFIPRWCTDIPQDKVDYTLQDMNNYLFNLVTKDLGFGQQIETYIKKIELEKEAEKQMDQEEETGEKLTVEDLDIEDYYEDLEEQKDADNDINIETNAYQDYEDRVKQLQEGSEVNDSE